LQHPVGRFLQPAFAVQFSTNRRTNYARHEQLLSLAKMIILIS
jgi:hypothetical protein